MSQRGRDDDDTPPWRQGVSGVRGVTPPGRRLPDKSHRPNAWSASGVQGVTPPGHAVPGQNTAANRAATHRKLQADLRTRRRQRPEKASDPNPSAPVRPAAGFMPDIFADIQDPPDLQDFLRLLSEFLDEHPPAEDALDDIEKLIAQSHAPFEIVVGFTMMSALVGKDEALREDFGESLERGAHAFFNLARRLNPHIRIPPGLSPQSVDALFYDLPDLALQVPFAFATDAFVRLMRLLRDPADEVYDELLLAFAVRLRRRFIDTRSFGDQPLTRLFPWAVPDWAPANFEAG